MCYTIKTFDTSIIIFLLLHRCYTSISRWIYTTDLGTEITDPGQEPRQYGPRRGPVTALSIGASTSELTDL